MKVTSRRVELVRDEARRLVRRSISRVRVATVSHSPGTEPLSIDRLISPLRYDVVVRQDFVAHLDANWAEYRRDPHGFALAATELPYYGWFRAVAVHHMGVAGSGEAALARAFERRIRRTARLVEGWRRDGFSRFHRLTIMRSGPTVAGTKHLGPRSYPIDGCHRLALLRLDGHATLEPWQYQVRVVDDPPIDNTGVLVKALGLDEDTYLRFVALGYDAGTARTADELLASVAPHEHDEVASVLAAHVPHLRERGASGDPR